MSDTLTVESWEDRSGSGGGPHSYGYVYFSDGSRVGYSHTGPNDGLQVWQPRTNGGGEYVSITDRHLRKAVLALTKAGVK